jgi:hypothetical protein
LTSPVDEAAETSCCVELVEFSKETGDRLLEVCRACCPRRDEIAAAEARAFAALEEELEKDEVDAEAVGRLAEELGDLRRESTVSGVKSLLGLRELVSAKELLSLLRCATSADECRLLNGGTSGGGSRGE